MFRGYMRRKYTVCRDRSAFPQHSGNRGRRCSDIATVVAHVMGDVVSTASRPLALFLQAGAKMSRDDQVWEGRLKFQSFAMVAMVSSAVALSGCDKVKSLAGGGGAP